MFSKFSGIEQAITAGIRPPAPAPSGAAPGSSGGSADVANSFPRPNGLVFPPYSMVAGGPAPYLVEDVTTPTFNRRPNPTKLFCNIHDKVQDIKQIAIV